MWGCIVEFFVKYKIKVDKKTLILLAGCVWIFAGSKLLSLGYKDFMGSIDRNVYFLGISIGVFLMFYNSIFKKMVKKHTERILNSKIKKHCVFSFFDVKGYIIMTFMITMGIFVRSSHLFEPIYLGSFYIGLGFSLLLSGAIFLFTAINFQNRKINYIIK